MMTRLLLASMLALIAALPVRAHAQSCSVAGTTINFGSISPVQAGNTDVTTTLTVNCSGFLFQGSVARACLNLGVGSGGGGVSPRVMTAGTNQLQYNLFADSTRSVAWGQRTTPSTPPISVDVPLGIFGAGSANVTVYGRVPGGQTTLPAGAYSQSFSGSSATVYALPNRGANTCSTITSYPSRFSLSASANLISDCLISATNMNFGTAGLLNTALTATSAITVNCTNQSPWTLALSAGTGSGATMSNRLLTRSGGSQTVGYNLFTSASYSSVWGDGTSGTATVTGTGTGVSQVSTVYGRVPAQTTPQAGTYNDTIIVTVSY